VIHSIATPKSDQLRLETNDMLGEHLHTFDRQLCDYTLANVLQHMHRSPFAAQVAENLARRPLLLDHLKNAADPSLDGEDVRLLLHDKELHSPETAVEFAVSFLWQPDRELHRRHLQTVVEARAHVTRQAAEDWSKECAEFSQQLEAERLRLQEGIEIIRQWVRRLRTLLRVMGAVDLLPAPEGRSPTPTHPTPAPTTQSTAPVAPLEPAGPVPSSEPIPDFAAVLSQLTDAVTKISAPAPAQPPPPEALSKEDAAKFLGVPVKTIEYLIRARKIQYAQLGSQRGRVIPVEALRKLLQEKTQLTAQEELQRRGRR
jgi:excisionase family DNA binding protein